MGIMNSDFVKFGIDVLTTFLEIINKSTNAFNGMFGSLTKIIGVFGFFKLGNKVFQKFRKPLINFFAEVVQKAKETGKNSAEAFD
jgi:hypothetical protein